MGTRHVPLDVSQPVWDRFFMVAPLVVIGTLEADGQPDLAPKHMVTPMGWQNYVGFVCTPSHATYTNIARTGEFTVSFPGPAQVVATSLTATPRCDATNSKPVLAALPTEPAGTVNGVLVADACVQLECRHHRTIDGFGVNSLITGEIVAARVHGDSLRLSDGDDQALIANAPVLCYLPPGRFATIADSNAFPFPRDMKK